MPSPAKTSAAVMWTTRTGKRFAYASPMKATGALARSMPTVVPSTTAARESKRDDADRDEQGFHAGIPVRSCSTRSSRA